eukprot:Hpha_TRINITY_DN16386_c3_g6::TRINITY_DN16386_c3_g6_i2::g.62705::m.62705
MAPDRDLPTRPGRNGVPTSPLRGSVPYAAARRRWRNSSGAVVAKSAGSESPAELSTVLRRWKSDRIRPAEQRTLGREAEPSPPCAAAPLDRRPPAVREALRGQLSRRISNEVPSTLFDPPRISTREQIRQGLMPRPQTAPSRVASLGGGMAFSAECAPVIEPTLLMNLRGSVRPFSASPEPVACPAPLSFERGVIIRPESAESTEWPSISPPHISPCTISAAAGPAAAILEIDESRARRDIHLGCIRRTMRPLQVTEAAVRRAFVRAAQRMLASVRCSVLERRELLSRGRIERTAFSRLLVVGENSGRMVIATAAVVELRGNLRLRAEEERKRRKIRGERFSCLLCVLQLQHQRMQQMEYKAWKRAIEQSARDLCGARSRFAMLVRQSRDRLVLMISEQDGRRRATERTEEYLRERRTLSAEATLRDIAEECKRVVRLMRLTTAETERRRLQVVARRSWERDALLWNAYLGGSNVVVWQLRDAVSWFCRAEMLARFRAERRYELRLLTVQTAAVCGSVAAEEAQRRLRCLRPMAHRVRLLALEELRRAATRSEEKRDWNELCSQVKEVRCALLELCELRLRGAEIEEEQNRCRVAAIETGERCQVLRVGEQLSRRRIRQLLATEHLRLQLLAMPLSHRAGAERIHPDLLQQVGVLRRRELEHRESIVRKRSAAAWRAALVVDGVRVAGLTCQCRESAARRKLLAEEKDAAEELSEEAACRGLCGQWSAAEVRERTARPKVFEEQERARDRIEQSFWREMYAGVRAAEKKAAKESKRSTEDNCVTLLLPNQQESGNVRLATDRVWWLHYTGNGERQQRKPLQRPRTAEAKRPQSASRRPASVSLVEKSLSCGGGTWFSTETCAVGLPGKDE